MASASEILKAYLHCARTPAEDAVERIRTQLKKQYGAAEVELTVSVEPDLISGYVLQVGGRVFDNSGKSALAAITADAPSLAVMQTRVEDYKPAATTAEGGTVISAADGVVDVKGMDQAVYGEIVTFDNGAKGMVESVEPDHLGIMLFDKIEEVGVGTLVTRSGKRAGIPVGDGFLGRVISPLGEPIDGKGPIEAEGYNPIEKQAPGILERQSVDTPLHTGILAIDSMFPIGRGQRELIIGDRQTGKTTIASDTIINQKGKDVICIYVAIGQKRSTVANLVQSLTEAVQLAPMVEEIFTDLTPLAEKSGITLELAGDGVMTGSDALIYRMIFNLTENAIKYNRPDGSVQVCITQEPEKLLILVSDTGQGIPEEYQQSIFQPFFRVDKSRSRTFGGAGLGLALVWEIANLHGGSVRVAESSDSGTTIAAELPRSGNHAADPKNETL